MFICLGIGLGTLHETSKTEVSIANNRKTLAAIFLLIRGHKKSGGRARLWPEFKLRL